MTKQSFLVDATGTLARLLLVLYPRAFRQTMGAAMVADLRRRAAVIAERRGVIGRVLWLLGTAGLLLWHAVGERRDGMAGSWAPHRLFGSWLDLKLGVRMLMRYPGLTAVAGLAMAFAIFVGATTFTLADHMVSPELPVPGGERAVGLRYWDRSETKVAWPGAHDFRVWRESLRTVEEIGAFYSTERTLGEGGSPVKVSVMSPAGFRIAGAAPLFGRTLIDADATAGAEPVIVLSHRAWQDRFAAAPDVVGRTVRFGSGHAMIVGVMPRGVEFPDQPQAWAPLRIDGRDAAVPELRVFGRLAAGATAVDAQSEVAALAPRTLAADASVGGSERREHLVAEVLPFLESTQRMRMGTMLRVMFYQFKVFALLFLVLVTSNVALLMYARALAREREIVVRNALGAGRARVVAQLCIEAFVLATVSTAVGLAATPPALRWIQQQVRDMGGDLPMGFETAITAEMVGYAFLLTLVASLIAGVVPGLKATGPDLQARLHRGSAGSGTARMGGIWSTVVVTQIAATVVFTAGAYLMAHQADRSGALEATFPAAEYLGVGIDMEAGETRGSEGPAGSAELLAHLREIERRLLGHPGVRSVTFAGQLPTKVHPSALIELDLASPVHPGQSDGAYEVGRADVDIDAFEVLQAPVIAGRPFAESDLDGEPGVVIVNASFVDEVLGGVSAVGRRIRYVSRDQTQDPAAWHEIVGVVSNLVSDSTRSLDLQERARARVYHPLDVRRTGSARVQLIIHAGADPRALVDPLYEVAGAVSPQLRLHEPVTLDWADPGLARGWRLYADLLSITSVVAMLLALSGIYSVMAFTVARRRREIGVRVALGARGRRVVVEIFRRPLLQVAAGIGLGCVLVGGGVWALTPGTATAKDAVLLSALCLGMIAVCLMACAVPTARALRIEPSEALSGDG